MQYAWATSVVVPTIYRMNLALVFQIHVAVIQSKKQNGSNHYKTLFYALDFTYVCYVSVHQDDTHLLESFG